MEHSLRLPVICTDEEILDRTLRICRRFKGIIKPQPIQNTAEAIEYINFELPEICLMNYSDRVIDIKRLFRAITSDPWLHSGGIILVYAKRDASETQRIREDINVISSIARGRFVASLYRVLKMILLNGQIIFQRELQPLLTGSINSSVEIDNDPFNAHIYANMISNFMCNIGFIDREKRDRLHIILFELVMNAIEHGNCQIDYDEKNSWLAKHGDIVELIRQKSLDPEIRKRIVHLGYSIGTDRSRFTVRDEGAGFDWRRFLLKKTAQPNLGQHGHGILMANHYAENLQFSEPGNEVCFEIVHDMNHANLMPGFLGGQHLINLHDGDILYHEGDMPEQLYYIISGTLKVMRGSSHIASLTPKDMFLGEISVLLNSRRTSTVISEGESTVVTIKRSNFARIIKQQPYYGIFLARMIARRVVQSKRFIAEGVWWSFAVDTPTNDAPPTPVVQAEAHAKPHAKPHVALPHDDIPIAENAEELEALEPVAAPMPMTDRKESAESAPEVVAVAEELVEAVEELPPAVATGAATAAETAAGDLEDLEELEELAPLESVG